MTLSLITAWMNSTWLKTPSGQHPAWLDDPLITATYAPAQIEQYWGKPPKQDVLDRIGPEFDLLARNAMALRAAGLRVVGGTDTGQSRFLIGYFNHLDLESMVAIGMTPTEAIVAGTRDAADIAHVNSGLVAAGRNADFIVLDPNPLDAIANTRRIDKVYLRGQEVPRAAMAAKWKSQFRQAASSR
jgi:predicted amidohydrolase YtcJ